VSYAYSRHYLRDWRKFRGMTQFELADLIQKTASTIWRLENRESGLTQQMLDALAKALGTSRAILDQPPPLTGSSAPLRSSTST
jgi:transcriptional regulator with XRE-family HTH domain